MSEGYKNPNCNKCGKEIKFIQLKFHDGTIKAVPCEVKDQYIMTMTDERTEKNQFIWKSTKIAVGHKCGEKEEVAPF